jgi:DNA polymerase-3 subunit delta'
MQPAAANALLKTLEEPNPDTTFILLTSAPTDILPTILSRCIRLTFQPLAEQDIAALLRQQGHPEKFARLAQGSIGRALDHATRPSLEEPLFRLFYERPSYPELSIALEKIEELSEDEDPVRQNRNVDSLLSAIFMWCRDQHARSSGLGESHLFFPDQPPASSPVPSLETLSKALAEARLALSRNMKFSVCLMRIFDCLRQ